MKRSNFKFLIPALAIVFALATAFTTSASSNVEAFSNIDGYIDNPVPCQIKVECSINPGPICTAVNDQGQTVQVFGKFNPLDTTCPRFVYKK